MSKLKIDKQKYIENHLQTVIEYFEIAQSYLEYVQEELKTIEKINNKE